MRTLSGEQAPGVRLERAYGNRKLVRPMSPNPGVGGFDADEVMAMALACARLVVDAGATVMRFRGRKDGVRQKADGSPVCEADQAAEAEILSGLRTQFPDMPVVAEEEAAAGTAPPPSPSFFLVDPLDGTREFVEARDQFTVNIALVHGGEPVLGAVYAPAEDRLWFGGRQIRPPGQPSRGDGERGGIGQQEGHGARAAKGAFAYSVIAPSGRGLPARSAWTPLQVREQDASGPVVLCSLSHLDPATSAFIDRLRPREVRRIGASGKFCVIAAGEADVYPRLSPTMEWDTAAGDAVLRAAGGLVLATDGAPLKYGKPFYRNSGFVAWGDPAAALPS